jgi:hypothetical protein
VENGRPHTDRKSGEEQRTDDGSGKAGREGTDGGQQERVKTGKRDGTERASEEETSDGSRDEMVAEERKTKMKGERKEKERWNGSSSRRRRKRECHAQLML